MSAEPFTFLTPELPTDGELTLVLIECQPAESNPWGVPAYLFHMIGRESGHYMGRIRLRVGWNENIIRYAGQLGYAVEPEFRGHHYAERACRLILPLARQHGLTQLWITCHPDNSASRRTLERLGAQVVETVDIPIEGPYDAGNERQKMCFRLDLA